ncbi:MAG: M56 family metallopeptidase [Oscillospiraceae bacterium]
MEQIVILLFSALICAACASWAFYARGQAESDLCNSSERKTRQTSLVDPLLLPLYLIIMFILAPFLSRSESTETLLVSSFILLLLYISVYYAVLLCVLPLLRRYFSARACATLWLLPNFLYLLVNFRSLNNAPPLFTLTLPRRWLEGIGLVWGAGFVLVLLWQIASHFRYRRFLLRGAEPVRDVELISLWENEQKRRAAKRMIPFLVSDRTQTPLTIGCYPRSMRLVLPHLNYTREEFQLIFRHEMRHIQRADTRTKAFLGFCTALCWFNPLMWVARRKVADDLELSCDELVLTYADEYTRKQYGRLLLDTAGSGKGYTTCLSAAASSLRYRLKNIVKPRQRLSGSLLVGFVLFALIMGSNTLALADSPDTVQTLVFEQALAGGVMDGIFIQNWGEVSPNRNIYGWDEEALTEYLGSLTVRQVYTADTYSPDGRRALIIDYRSETSGRWCPFFLCDGLLFVEFPFDGQDRLTFLLEDEIDWDHIASLLDFDAEAPEE